MRIILDTNLWISYLISKRLQSIDQLFVQSAVRLIFSRELLEEFITVSQRSKFSKYFNQRDIDNLLVLFESYGELVEVHSVVEVCRDAKDNFLLALAKDDNVDYLVTGDEDLLVLSYFTQTRIINYADFERIYLQ
jgi:putative PIN family toxin of toxin-antitoxin system